MNEINTTVRTERMKLVGVGRAGCNVVSRITEEWDGMLPAVAVSTDARTLDKSKVPTRLQIGRDLTGGMGAGGDPAIGRQCAEEDAELLKGLFADTDLVFIVAGLGGGTGTGVTPVMVRMAHEAGAMTICLVTTPFRFEGSDCMTRAEDGLQGLLDSVDVGVVVPNESMFGSDGDMKLKEAFSHADESLGMGVCALWKLISEQGVINMGFSDFRNLLRGHGEAYALGYGWGEGADRASDAVNAALASPILGENSVSRAESLLVGIIGDDDMTLNEINSVMDKVRTTTRKTAGVFMGAVVDGFSDGRMLVTLLASQRRTSARQPVQSDNTGREETQEELVRKDVTEVTQTDFELVTAPSKGRFKDVEPTILHGEDLDVPTYMRRGIHLEK